MTYHMVCQIASHTSWLLVLVNLMSQPIGLYEGVAYVSGYTIGSLIGAKISMRIETLIGATA